MFVDKARIKIAAGNGGDGAVSFHREKYVAAGGPDGGNGGRGGNVVFVADTNLSTLLDFKYKKKYIAANGENGSSGNCSGKGADDLIIRVPLGTVVRDFETGSVVADISSDKPVTVAYGGKGGFGNTRFATPTRQVPRFAKKGHPGDQLEVILELKLIADVGFVGFPNVGKSTLLSVISDAKPKIGNYHFTTLSPMLGVVRVGNEQSFVAADIPGLIEGAATGIGLGYDFLRHIERCRMLVHVVDVSGSEGRDPTEDFIKINNELKQYNERLSTLPQLVVGNKSDVSTEHEAALKAYVEEHGYSYLSLSAATHKNIDILIQNIWIELQKLPPVVEFIPDYVKPLPPVGNTFNIEPCEDGFVIEAPWLERILATTDVSDYESLMYFQRAISDSGINQALADAHAKENDTVYIGEYQFDYIP